MDEGTAGRVRGRWAAGETVVPEGSPAPAAVLDRERANELLVGVLDALGAAHHRPFSRS